MSSSEPTPPSQPGTTVDLRGWKGLALTFVVALAIRLLFSPIKGFVYDRQAFTDWMIALQRHPLADFYQLPHHVPADHLPGTLWLLTGLGTLASWLGVSSHQGGFTITPAEAQPFLKALPILADLAVGALIVAIVRQVASERRQAALLTAGSWLFAPGVLFVSAIWGQWDAISLVFMFAAFLLAMRGRNRIIAVPPMIALAMLMKPQFALLAPIIGIFVLVNAIPEAHRTRRAFMSDRRSQVGVILAAIWREAGWRLLLGGGIAVGMVTLAGWPFHVGLLPHDGWTTYADRATFAANRFQGTTYGAISLWIIPLGTEYPPHDTERIVGAITAAHLGWTLVATSTILGFVIAHRHRWSAVGLIAGSTVTYLGFTLFATRMHERYLMPGLALALLLAGLRPALGTIVPALALSLAYFVSVYCSYTSFSFNPYLPLRDWRTGLLLSSLGVIGILAFITIVVSAWRTADHRQTTRIRPLPSFPNSPMGVETPSGESSQGASA